MSKNKTKKSIEQLMKQLEAYRNIAGEAIALADAYAGGESENANKLNSAYEKLEIKRKQFLLKLNDEE